jgi:prolyl 4-hydroxylase
MQLLLLLLLPALPPLVYSTSPQILSWHPRIVVFPNFIDRARAQHIIQLASSRMQPSTLSYRPNEEANPNQQIRTSTGVFLNQCVAAVAV